MALSSDDVRTELIGRAARTAADLYGGPPGGADSVSRFVTRYYRRVSAEDLTGRQAVDVAGAALAHWRLAARRSPGETHVRVYNPVFDHDGWQSRHTVVDVVVEDTPFLVDSVTMALNRQGLGVHLVVHPVLHVERDADGTLRGLAPATAAEPGDHGDGSDAPLAEPAECFVHVEVDRVTDDARLAAVADDLRRVLADVRAATSDWVAMRDRLEAATASLRAVGVPVEDDVKEVEAFLQWLAEDHFTFVGARDYDLVGDGDDAVVRAVPGSGLGILRGGGERPPRPLASLTPEARALARRPRLLTVTKANAPATVHRPTRLDYVGLKRFDAAGRVVGERRFLGLFTASAYHAPAMDIPLVGRKLRAVLDRADLTPGSHNEHELLQILESCPRDELFQVDEDELYRLAMGVLQLQERRLVRCFARREAFGRYVSCLVYLPRDRYTTATRRAVQDVLLASFRGTDLDWRAEVSDSVLARLHVVVRIAPGDHGEVDGAAVDARLAEVTRSWGDELADALVDEHGEEAGLALHRRWGSAFPAGYREAFVARSAVGDIRRLEELGDGDAVDGLGLHLYTVRGGREGEVRLKLYRAGPPLSLSDVLPVVQGMGVTVVDERPFEVTPEDAPPRWIYDFGLRFAPGISLATDRLRASFAATFAAVWRGDVESDGFNRLTLGAGIDWRDIAVLRAYARYLRQVGSPFSLSYVEDTLVAHPTVTRLLVTLFHARFDPRPPGEEAPRRAKEATLGRHVEAALDDVVGLAEDRILRSVLALVRATVRTNVHQRDGEGRPRAHLAFKLDPALVPDLPLPRPAVELFVYSPRVEGVHLRAGRVARGGIRWSDRREDYRTEVLGLMKAQAVKNAVIVPVGAKGGFVVKAPPAGADPDVLRAEVVGCYRTFISGLLDLTDNLVDGVVVPPADVVRHDGDDPYLVVAADKGTATFSDEANALAAAAGFWLGDAFASGGSAGYDHKAMGITARGAWESVRRHFRVLGVDADRAPLTVVGIGDMSGDVFGNGLLLSRHVRLVGAFDHRHVFLDPDPDPAAGWAERRRLYTRPGSSWADYDGGLISAGGGVFPRTAKAIPLAPEARAVLGVDDEALPPTELIRALLRAPVDLLWNGGVGTYVKARGETHAEVGDKANDAVRVDAADLRCRVVAEGGNLGLTQRARVELARAGGRVNTDAIDNSAGVDCSDHEVNIKILLDQVVAAGDLTVKQRNALLADMTDEVAALVLRDNIEQVRAIDVALAQAPARLGVHARYLRRLEQSGRLTAGERGTPPPAGTRENRLGGGDERERLLDRAVEFLPDEVEIEARRAAGEGLTAPELAVLLAYTKNLLAHRLVDSDVPEDPFLGRELLTYFPTALRARVADRVAAHPLRREIVATAVANRTVNRAGITFIFRISEETSATVPDLVRAHAAATELFALDELADEIGALDARVPAAVQTAMLLDVRRLAERATRWLIHHRRPPLDIAATVAALADGVGVLGERLAALVGTGARRRIDERVRALAAEGVPRPLAGRVAALDERFATLDIAEVALRTAHPIDDVADVYFRLGDELDLDWLRDRITDLSRSNRWEALARAALRDDLRRLRAGLAADVVRTPAGGEGAEPLGPWLAANDGAVQRYRRVLGDVTESDRVDLAPLSVVVREIRNLIESQRVSGGEDERVAVPV